jgi:DNA-binding transcriptional MerR regulator
MGEQTYTVGQVAGLAGVTVRTLHHYDEIGLLPPSGRAANGYRTYTPVDLARLQRVLSWRELGFDLEQVAALVATDGSGAAARGQLQAQHSQCWPGSRGCRPWPRPWRRPWRRTRWASI